VEAFHRVACVITGVVEEGDAATDGTALVPVAEVLDSAVVIVDVLLLKLLFIREVDEEEYRPRNDNKEDTVVDAEFAFWMFCASRMLFHLEANMLVDDDCTNNPLSSV
jgi:hypothetical protein